MLYFALITLLIAKKMRQLRITITSISGLARYLTERSVSLRLVFLALDQLVNQLHVVVGARSASSAATWSPINSAGVSQLFSSRLRLDLLQSLFGNSFMN